MGVVMSDDVWDRVLADQNVGMSWPSPSLEVRRKILAPKQLQPTKFLRGPVPIPWLNAAADANPLALRVGLALWFISGCKGEKTTVTLNKPARAAMGLTAARVHRGLRALVAARLVEIVKQRPGAHPVVKLVELAGDATESCDLHSDEPHPFGFDPDADSAASTTTPTIDTSGAQ
jgi:hypothetical protein